MEIVVIIVAIIFGVIFILQILSNLMNKALNYQDGILILKALNYFSASFVKLIQKNFNSQEKLKECLKISDLYAKNCIDGLSLKEKHKEYIYFTAESNYTFIITNEPSYGIGTKTFDEQVEVLKKYGKLVNIAATLEIMCTHVASLIKESWMKNNVSNKDELFLSAKTIVGIFTQAGFDPFTIQVGVRIIFAKNGLCILDDIFPSIGDCYDKIANKLSINRYASKEEVINQKYKKMYELYQARTKVPEKRMNAYIRNAQEIKALYEYMEMQWK